MQREDNSESRSIKREDQCRKIINGTRRSIRERRSIKREDQCREKINEERRSI